MGTAVLQHEQAAPLVLAGGRQVRSGCVTVVSAGDGPPATAGAGAAAGSSYFTRWHFFSVSTSAAGRLVPTFSHALDKSGCSAGAMKAGLNFGHPCHLKPPVASQIPLPLAPASHNPAAPQTQMQHALGSACP